MSRTSHPNPAWPDDVAGLLARVQAVLDDGKPQAALDAVTGSGVRSPWVENARGVCLLRLGRAARAVDVLRGLVFDATGLWVRADIHTVFEANYATALLLCGNTDGFHGVLSGIRDRTHPAVARLRDAVRHWKAGMTWGEWLRCAAGSPPRPLTLDFPPGVL